MFAPGGLGKPPLPFFRRLIGNRCALPIFALLLTSASGVAQIRPSDCGRAAKYSESKRGVSMLVMQNGRTIFEHYANGESARWPQRMMDYSGSTISFRTRSLSGKATHANRGSPFASCSAKPTALKALRVFSGHRFETETQWQFDCRRLLNPVRLSFMARVIFRFFPNCCAGN